MKRLNIGFDVDDVLADFQGKFVELCHARFGKPALDYRPSDWNWSTAGLTPAQIDEAWSCVKATRNFWENLRVAEGAGWNALLKLASHRLFFITARVPTTGHTEEDQTAMFLRQHFNLDFPTVVVTANKGPIAAALQLDYFIDDRPKNCLEVQKAVGSRCRVCLKDASHNQGVFIDGVRRVKDLNEFVSMIQKENKNNASSNR